MSATEFVETAGGLAAETLPDLTEFAETVGGPLQPGWYKAEVIEGYGTRSGKQFVTGDAVSQKGDSRNMTICYRVTPKVGEPRNLFERINYRASDFTAERLEYIKEAREEFKGVQGRWSDSDAQRSSLAIATIGQLQGAVGFKLPTTASGINPASMASQQLDIRLKVDANGYNEVTGHAKLGTFTARPAKANGKAST